MYDNGDILNKFCSMMKISRNELESNINNSIRKDIAT